MKQVLVRGGKVRVEEVPAPALMAGCVRVHVQRSLISSGTESAILAGGGAVGLLAKRARDPRYVDKLKRAFTQLGVKQTVQLVQNKLFEPQAPGYSSAGIVTEVGAGVPGLAVGDRVACAGLGYASHAHVNVVPHNLCALIPDGVDFDDAAFTTLGAIAVQGMRRAEPQFGETIVVLGLGLLGLITVQLGRAAGCRVIGCDPQESRRTLAQDLGAQAVCAPGDLEDLAAAETAGHGADAVLVCASAKDSTVTRQALDICRVRGRVVVVGAVGMDLPREPLYMKEIDFRLSCSLGPGRYQPGYEEKGNDYPFGYVRWTEGRNMAAFLALLAEGRVRVQPLVSLVKPIAEAEAAYAALGSEAIGVLLRYDDEPPETAQTSRLVLRADRAVTGDVGVAVIGAGAFASAWHLPSLKRLPGVSIEAVAARTGPTAQRAGSRFGARYCTTDVNDILQDERVHAVVISTRHHLHAEQCIAAAQAGKHIFVEKPLALTVEECEAVCAAVEEAGVLLTVGFNRRFAPTAQALHAALAKTPGPRMLTYRCNAGALPTGHWTMDPEVGGGRIVGECVHFYDLCCWLGGGEPDAIEAQRIVSDDARLNAEDNLHTLLRWPGGHTAAITYTALGHTGLGKERLEVFAGGGAAVLDDYRTLALQGLPGAGVRGKREDKGQFALMEHFVAAVRGEAALAITAADGLRATRIAREALRRAGQ